MTTPIQFEIATLEAEATELLLKADRKEQMAGKEWAAGGAKALLRDAEIFREEAASKRAKAERLRKAAQ